MRQAARRTSGWVQCVPPSRSAYLADGALQDRVAFHFVLATTALAALAAEVVAHHSMRAAGGLAGLFDALASDGTLPSVLAQTAVECVELRNRILFDLDAVNTNEVFDLSLSAPEALTEIIGICAEALQS